MSPTPDYSITSTTSISFQRLAGPSLSLRTLVGEDDGLAVALTHWMLLWQTAWRVECVSSNASGDWESWPGGSGGDAAVVAGGGGQEGRLGRAGSRGLLRQKQQVSDS